MTLSAFSFPLSGGLDRRGLATGDQQIVWCCANSTTYITVNTSTQIASSPGFDITKTLHDAIQDVEARITRVGNAMVRGGQWGFALDEVNVVSAKDTGDTGSKFGFRHLTWPVLRDGLKAVSDLIADRDLAKIVRGLQFGINSAFFGEVGMGYIG